jgi:hypothetical protein
MNTSSGAYNLSFTNKLSDTFSAFIPPKPKKIALAWNFHISCTKCIQSGNEVEICQRGNFTKAPGLTFQTYSKNKNSINRTLQKLFGDNFVKFKDISFPGDFDKILNVYCIHTENLKYKIMDLIYYHSNKMLVLLALQGYWL